MLIYERMIKELSKQVNIFMNNSKSRSKPEEASFSQKITPDVLVSELHIIEKYKDEHIELNTISEKEEIIEIPLVFQTADQVVQVRFEGCDKETNIGFVYFEAETQTYFLCNEETEKLNRQSIDEYDNEIRDLHEAGLIPNNIVDVESWSAGYFTGLDRGKTLAHMESMRNEELITGEDANSESDYNLTRNGTIEELKEENTPEEGKGKEEEKSHKNDKKKKNLTKFKQFNFQKREKIVQAKVVKSKKIRENFSKAKPQKIKKNAKMSKKMLMKAINNTYSALLAKYKNEEFSEDLLEFIYNDLESKTSSKKVLDRKINELLFNLVNTPHLLKAKTFLKFLEMNEKIQEPPFLFVKESLNLYLAGVDWMIKSKAGILSEFSEFSDSQFVPTVRMTEFFKTYFSESFPLKRVSRMVEFVEKHSDFDKKRLNKLGVVEMEFMLNYAISQFEEHCIAVKGCGEMILRAINCNNNVPEVVKKNDLASLAGWLRPGKVFKELEGINNDLIQTEDIFASGLREIFPEEFLDRSDFGKIDEEYSRTLEMVSECSFFKKSGIWDMFEAYGMELDVEVLAFLQKIVELCNRVSL